MSITRKIIYFIEYTIVRTAGLLLALLPARFFYFLIKQLALFTFHILKIRRDVSINNLNLALGDKSNPGEINKICRDSYISVGITFFEMLIFQKLKKRITEMVDISDISLIRKNINRGRGMILVTCHLGNWELAGASLAAAGIPATGVGARQSNPYVDAYIYRTRTALGLKVVQPDASIKHLVKALKNHEVIGLVSDQNAGEYGVFVDFFGKTASTPQGAAQLVLKYKAPLLVMVTVRTAPGRYRNIIKEVEIKKDDTVETITQRFTTIMEKIIRQYPEQYLWMHRRWKTRPPGES